MKHRYGRMVTADDFLIDGIAYRPGAPAASDDLESAKEERNVDVALEVFQDAVDQEVAERLAGNDALTERLARVRRTVQEKEDALHVADHLVGYGYNSVLLWLRLVQADEQCPVGLAERDLAEIAKETVARAVNRGGDAGSAVAFLVRCLHHLPSAYEGWRLGSGVLEAGEFEESVVVGESFISALRRRLVDIPRVRELMRKWAPSDCDGDELIANTRQALRRPGEMP